MSLFDSAAPRWAVMWALAFAVYGACKTLTWRAAAPAGTPVRKQLAYLVAWPGMDAAAFLGSTGERPRLSEWLFAVAKSLIGVVLLCGLFPGAGSLHEIVRAWLGIAGVAFLLHFGLFHLLSCLWRSVGFDARPLMDWPIAATSVGDFWGRRWNRAFRDIAFRFLFRPLTVRVGPRAALFGAFLFSGLVHDLVITVPAGGGYGGPTAFFLIQALGMTVERSEAGRAIGLGRGPAGWLFTAAVVVAPVPLLFPPAFLERVIVPFLLAIGAH